jgi:ubiquitin-like 1-activating enzyme E1 A
VHTYSILLISDIAFHYSQHLTRPTNMAAPPTTSEIASNGNMASNAPSSSNGASTDSNIVAPGLSADDFALYDRQIRLWGAQAQERIRNAHILLVSLRALGTEIAKNLTLAGISSLTIVDDEPVTEEDLGSCYFLRDEDVGKPVRAERRQVK